MSDQGHIYELGNAIKPVLVGTAIDRRLRVAIDQANIDPVLWKYHEDEHAISIEHLKLLKWNGNNSRPDWAEKINRLMYHYCEKDAKKRLDFEIEFLFDMATGQL